MNFVPDSIRVLLYEAGDNVGELCEEASEALRRSLSQLYGCCAAPPPPTEEPPYETTGERNWDALLEPFGLEELRSVVGDLARNGLTDKGSAFMTEQELFTSCPLISQHDRLLILLAVWLQSAHMQRYGPGLVRQGATSLLKLAAFTEADMANSGVQLIGHRKALARQIREAAAARPELFVGASAGLSDGVDEGLLKKLLRERAAAKEEDWQEEAKQFSIVSPKAIAAIRGTGQDVALKLGRPPESDWRPVSKACLTDGKSAHLPTAPEPSQIQLVGRSGGHVMSVDLREGVRVV